MTKIMPSITLGLTMVGTRMLQLHPAHLEFPHMMAYPFPGRGVRRGRRHNDNDERGDEGTSERK